MSNLTLIIILAVVIIVMSIITAFGKAVGSGANVSDLFPEDRKVKEPKAIVQTNRNSKVLRTIAGFLFGVLVLCPILYGHRINGELFININHQFRDNLVGFLIVIEVLVLVTIFVIDRKPQK
jgi:hypothetical protein